MGNARYLEHPEDVLAQWHCWAERGAAALAFINHTEGGAVRAVGALMAVSSSGDVAGYVSGGCIDADVILNAAQALETGRAMRLRYGAGSPFKDLPLPCGGAIEVTIFPKPDRSAIAECLLNLRQRRTASLRLGAGEFVVEAHYTPKLRLRIAGRGADAIALANLAEQAGIETTLWLRDTDDLAFSQATFTHRLETPTSLPPADDDAWTAFVLMFHDGDWEGPLLRQALSGSAFYIGAVGSQRTHAKRLDALRRHGVPNGQVSRIRGPIGLVPSMRDASMLAVSALAEIVSEYHASRDLKFRATAMVMLAAGQSSRFERGDKLLAPYRGGCLMDHAAGLLQGEAVASRLGIVGPGQSDRAMHLADLGWQVIENEQAVDGQGTSLAKAIGEVEGANGVQSILLLLADMPNIPEGHLEALQNAMTPVVEAVMTRADGVLCPPALFHHSVFSKLRNLTGDRGARGVFDELENTGVVDLAPHLARDVDCVDDLAELTAGALNG
ncbi:MAG: NTP transferase domain-containing protein [Pseudomonadota bacterium]